MRSKRSAVFNSENMLKIDKKMIIELLIGISFLQNQVNIMFILPS